MDNLIINKDFYNYVLNFIEGTCIRISIYDEKDAELIKTIVHCAFRDYFESQGVIDKFRTEIDV